MKCLAIACSICVWELAQNLV